MKKVKLGAPALLFVLVLMAGLTLTGCLDPGVGPGGGFNPVGTWSNTWSHTWSDGGSQGHCTLTLRADGTYTWMTVGSFLIGGSWTDFTDVSNGTYRIIGEFILLQEINSIEQGVQFIVVDNNTMIWSPGYDDTVWIRTR